jgi:tRNA A-37 threonylcarbamoyl transferase component Bud32
MLGQILGNHRIIRKLGEGGMGAVYLGEHCLLGRQAAIKVLHPSLSDRPDVVMRFFNEARAATAIVDPGIVAVFDFGHHSDGSAFLVMEFLHGESLDTRLARGPLPMRDALRLARQIATTLAAAHAKGIVHRDLKPENVFLVPDAEVIGGERVKILDFGIAKLLTTEASARTQAGAIMGTPAYMSPEQCRGAPDIDHRTDIYALGCALFQMVTGRTPFAATGLAEMIAAQLATPAPPPSSLAPWLPPALDRVVARCLAKAPADRYASMIEVAAALELIVTTDAATVIAAAPAPVAVGAAPQPTTLGGGAGEVTVAPRPRRPWLVGGALALVAGVAGLVGLVVAGGGGGAPTGAAVDPTPSRALVDGGAPPPDAAPAPVAPPPDATPTADAPAADVAAEPVEPVDAAPRPRRRRSATPATPAPAPSPTAPPPIGPARCPIGPDGLPTERC